MPAGLSIGLAIAVRVLTHPPETEYPIALSRKDHVAPSGPSSRPNPLENPGVTSDYSAKFYTQHARRYAEVAHGFVQSQYVSNTHPELKDDLDLMSRLKGLLPCGAKGLDAGCGGGARDVFYYWRDGYDILGIDTIQENVDVAKRMHPEMQYDVTAMVNKNRWNFLKTGFQLCGGPAQGAPWAKAAVDRAWAVAPSRTWA